MHVDGWRCFVNVDVGSMDGVERVNADGHVVVEKIDNDSRSFGRKHLTINRRMVVEVFHG